jgi:hypothetical protein
MMRDARRARHKYNVSYEKEVGSEYDPSYHDPSEIERDFLEGKQITQAHIPALTIPYLQTQKNFCMTRKKSYRHISKNMLVNKIVKAISKWVRSSLPLNSVPLCQTTSPPLNVFK